MYVTVTVKSSVPVFPAASDAVQVTVVVVTEKNEPEAGEQVGPEVTLTLSVAVTSNVTAVPDGSDEVVDMLDGTVMVGEIASVVWPACGAPYTPCGKDHTRTMFDQSSDLPFTL